MIVFTVNNYENLHSGTKSSGWLRYCPDEISIVFAETEVNNFGRAMAYLTLVYVLDIPENAMREAVRLVATVLKDMDLSVFKVEESYF